jgi:NAD(P)-dependent dehydrogenase (short-subunit alcohol dehydrogenase family)
MRMCIVTGGNAGIGRRAAEQLASRGMGVVMACRSQDRGEEARKAIMQATGSEHVWVLQADLSLLSDVRRLVDAYHHQFDRLDVLINNAADFDLSRKQPLLTREGNEAQFATNVLAPHLLSTAFLPLLQESDDGRILDISSQGLVLYPNLRFDFDHVDGSGRYSPAKTYYQNKLGLLMNALTLREKLAEKNSKVKVQAIRVTNVRIDLDRYPNLSPLMKAMYSIKRRMSITPEKMAEVYTVLAMEPGHDGFLYDEKLHEVKANRYAYDSADRDRLWALCCKRTGQLS